MKNKKRRQILLSPPTHSEALLVCLPRSQVGLFRFLLEAHDHVALFTVCDRHVASLKVIFSPHQADAVQTALAAIATEIELTVSPWLGSTLCMNQTEKSLE